MAAGFAKGKQFASSNVGIGTSISHFKNIHDGKRCFLIGNGPSLSVQDLDRLRGEITFACNNIYLAFTDTTWRPTYYTVSDPLAAAKFSSTIETLSLGTKIFSDSVKPSFEESTNTIWLRQIQYAKDDDLTDFAFSFDLANGVYHGATTLYIQLQTAFYMGITEVYLIGVDFDYQSSSRSVERSGLGVIVEHQEETNHFHPDYRKPGERWWLPDKEFQFHTYTFAKSIFESYGRSIYNASRKTALDVFPLVDFDLLLNLSESK